LVTGIADAQIDSTPMVCIWVRLENIYWVVMLFRKQILLGFQLQTKWNYQITEASEIPEIMAKAFYIARSGRPGPVLVDITKNAQFDKFELAIKVYRN
jgi:acetolactate synthase-1/2/3 large subunit